MKKFKVTATASFTIVTEVEAKTIEEAEQIAQDRDVDVCIHGSEFADGINTVDFTLEDGCCDSFDIHGVDEIESETEEEWDLGIPKTQNQ